MKTVKVDMKSLNGIALESQMFSVKLIFLALSRKSVMEATKFHEDILD